MDARIIWLTCGAPVFVDAPDYEALAAHRWYLHPQGYAMRTAVMDGKRTTIYMHREILGATTEELIDHRNHDGLDNRRANLRRCNRSQNNQNARGRYNRRSKYKGVAWDSSRQRWRAEVVANGSTRFVGRFDDERSAALAYDRAAREQYGEFACLNFPEDGERLAVITDGARDRARNRSRKRARAV